MSADSNLTYGMIATSAPALIKRRAQDAVGKGGGAKSKTGKRTPLVGSVEKYNGAGSYNVNMPNIDGVNFIVNQGFDIVGRLMFESIEAAQKANFREVVSRLRSLIIKDDRKLYVQIVTNMLQRGKIYESSLIRAIEYANKHDISIIGLLGNGDRYQYRLSNNPKISSSKIASPETVNFNKKIDLCKPSPDAIDFMVNQGFDVVGRLKFKSLEQAKSVRFSVVLTRLRMLTQGQGNRIFKNLGRNLVKDAAITKAKLSTAMICVQKHNLVITGQTKGADGLITYTMGEKPAKKAAPLQPH